MNGKIAPQTTGYRDTTFPSVHGITPDIEVYRPELGDGHDDVRWEYPGFLAVPLDATHEVATGQHNWESGDVQVLVDNAWEPMDEVLDFATPEDCTDEYRIAALIYGAVRRWQEAHRG